MGVNCLNYRDLPNDLGYCDRDQNKTPGGPGWLPACRGCAHWRPAQPVTPVQSLTLVRAKRERVVRVRPKLEVTPHELPWPLAARGIAALRKEADRGAGDTLARLIKAGGGNTYKAVFMALTGRSCGCGQRQDWLNKRFPYTMPAGMEVAADG